MGYTDMALFTRKLRDELQANCSSIREELDDHLDAINAQALDVSEVRDVMSELDEKIEKLAGRIDELYLLLGADTALSEQEKALAAYLQAPRSLDDVASFLSVSAPAVERALRTLALKGVSVVSLPTGTLTTNSTLRDTQSLQSYL